MTSQDPRKDPASALVEAAHAFHRAAEARGSHVDAPESLASLQDALQVLSTAWYRLAADAVPGIVDRHRGPSGQAGASPLRGGLSREQEVRLVGALHDVAAAFARCGRACRDAGSTVTPLISRSVHAGRPGNEHSGGEVSWFGAGRPPGHVERSCPGEGVLR
jgi:hypothetical protein